MSLTCYIIHTHTLSAEVLRKYVEDTEGLELAGVAHNTRQAVNKLLWGDIQADFTFLDIEMQEMNGPEIVRSIGHCTQVVLLTDHKEPVSQTACSGIPEYLTKPLNYLDFLQCIVKVKSAVIVKRTISCSSGFIFTPGNGKGARIKIPIDDIIYIKAASNYLHFVLKDRSVMSYATLEKVMASLPQQMFCRVHRSYAVHLKMIANLDAFSVTMLNGSDIPIGKTYRKAFKERIMA